MIVMGKNQHVKALSYSIYIYPTAAKLFIRTSVGI